ncbi:MAG: sugar-binding protein [Verrucomicrobiales bacterium]|nr:sugar-binding protein [Verrucomicrobiales bacterium]
MMKIGHILGSLGIAAFALLLSGCKDEPSQKRFAFVTNGVADFWTIAEAGARAAGEDFGVDTQILMPSGITDQKQMLEDLITRGVDGIAVSPIDPSNQTEIINQAAEAAALVTHDSDAPDSNRLLYIGMDNYTAGRMCGQLVKEALPDGGSIMIMIGRMEQDNAKRRRQGVIDELMDRSEDPSRYDPPGTKIEGDKYTILDTLTDQFDRSKAKANAEDTLSRYPEVSAMVGLFAYNPPAILQALEQAGKLNTVKVIAFDEDAETLAGIQSGAVYGTVVQNPYQYGYKSIELLKAIESGDKSMIPEDRFINIEGRQIRKDNVDEFWADLKIKTGKE